MTSRMIRVFVAALACGWLLTAAGPAGFGPSAAWASAEFDAAQQMYDQSKFAEAIAALQQALGSGAITGTETQQARELLARCQVKAGDAAGARRTFLGILRQDPLYRPDPNKVPPDEMAGFDEAKRVFDAEQEREAARIPASIALGLGLGSGDNKDFGEFVKSGGGDGSYENQPFISGSVRFPLRPRLSLEIELQRFRATNSDSFSVPNNREFKITAIPLAISLHYLVVQRPKWRASVFAGGGPMLQTTTSMDLGFIGARLQIAEDKVGTYLHGGAEGEYLLHPRFSVSARAFGRYAKATGYFEKSTLFDYDPAVPIKNRDVDFSGFGATLGLRAYIGY